MASIRAVRRARTLVGTPFRPQGRAPTSGVDCIGLIVAVYRLDPSTVPDDYRLCSPQRGGELLDAIRARFRPIARAEPGHLVLMRIGSRQWHLGVRTERGIVHADARRGAVLEGPLPQGAIVIGNFRLRRRRRPEE